MNDEYGYEITDTQGVIASADSEDEGLAIFEQIRNGEGDYQNFCWKGDLKLVKIIALIK